jgi:hypothetical protein
MSSIGNGTWRGQRTTVPAAFGRMLVQSKETSQLVRKAGGQLAPDEVISRKVAGILCRR